MGKFIDLTGQTFGQLTVIERDPNQTCKSIRWLCKCSCGNPNLISVFGNNLRRNHSTSCKDCLAYEMIGKQFGSLFVVQKDEPQANDKEFYYLCQCSCGNPNPIRVRGTHLRRGEVQSCGECNRYNMIGQRFRALTVIEAVSQEEKSLLENCNHTGIYFKCKCDCGNPEHVIIRGDSLRDGSQTTCGKCSRYKYIGQTFGYLTVLEPDLEYMQQRQGAKGTYVKCRCSCVNQTVVTVNLSNLIRGLVQSCGCIKSIGETQVQQVLQANNISFEKEKTFDDLINLDTGKKYRYDFYLPDYNRLIEFDGEQHFITTKGGWNTEENLKRVQESDSLKNEYAKTNNINLVRIPYWERNHITSEMLLGDAYLV